MRIDSLNTSITQMNSKDAHEFILSLRKRRRLAPTLTPTRRKKKKVTKQPSVNTMIKSLTPEQAAQLLEVLK